MKKVYICSPYRGDTETNIQNARVYLKTQKCPKRQEKDTKGFYHRK